MFFLYQKASRNENDSHVRGGMSIYKGITMSTSKRLIAAWIWGARNKSACELQNKLSIWIGFYMA